MLISCEKCEKRDTCKETCEAIEKVLFDQGIYDADYIRPQLPSHLRSAKNGNWREIPFSACNRDKDGNTSHMLRDY